MAEDTPDRGKRNALGQMARPIRLPWKCHRTGDCCQGPMAITVTAEEKQILEEQSGLARLTPEFTIHPEEEAGREKVRAQGMIVTQPVRFYQMERKTGCPFLVEHSCVVYATRPYNCRRFMCGRVDPTQESFEEGGPMGNFNLSDRIDTSLRFQEYYRSQERRAQKEWALSHGWNIK